jgi:phage repressor protein C with HTH and peptisase S24 domain
MNARDRLAELARQRGSSLAALSRMIDRNGSYLQQYITKGSPRRLEEQDRRRLAQFFGVPDRELGGSEEPPAHDWVAVPRLSLEVSAGPGTWGGVEVPFDQLGFSRRWLRERGLDAALLSAIQVSGDSMEPLLRDGDEILVDRAPRAFREGVHVLRLGEVLHVKRVQAGPPGRLLLVSENRAYGPIEVAAGEVELLGRVVWKSGRL